MAEADKSRAGVCNICNQWQRLTFDHVPPQGTIEPTPVEVKYYLDHLRQTAKGEVNCYSAGEIKPRIRRRTFSQNGLKFQSICAKCNNELLGARYDPELKRVAAVVAQLVRTRFDAGILLPGSLTVAVQTHLLMRSIIGHLLAAQASPNQGKPRPGFDNGFYKAMRQYFLDESLPLPPELCVYYWPYLAKHQVVMPGLGISAVEGGAAMVGDLIKFFPLAFYVAGKSFGGGQLPVRKILGDGCNDLSCTVHLYIDLDDVPPIDWPETPTSRHWTIMPLECSVVAVPRDRISWDSAQPWRSTGRKPRHSARFRR